MGLSYGINNPGGRIPEEESYRILETAYNSGVRELDTAEAYGSAHHVIGDFHKKHSNQRFNIITKIPDEATDSNVYSRLLNYKDELNVEKLEAVMYHSFSKYNSDSELKDALTGLKEEGLFNYLGVSIYTNEELKQVIQDDTIDLVQLPFNLFDNRAIRGDLLERAKMTGKIIHTRSAFLQGLFFKNPGDDHPVVCQLFEPLNKIRSISKEYQIPIAVLALLYCLKQENIDRVIIGVDSLDQFETNLSFCEHDLSRNLMDELDSIHIDDRKLLNPSLWS